MIIKIRKTQMNGGNRDVFSFLIFLAYIKLKTFRSYFLSFGQGLKLMVQKVFDDNNSNRNSLKFPFSL